MARIREATNIEIGRFEVGEDRILIEGLLPVADLFKRRRIIFSYYMPSWPPETLTAEWLHVDIERGMHFPIQRTVWHPRPPANEPGDDDIRVDIVIHEVISMSNRLLRH